MPSSWTEWFERGKISFFASKELAEAFHTEAGNKERSLEAMAGKIRDVFPEAIAEYGGFADFVNEAMLEY